MSTNKTDQQSQRSPDMANAEIALNRAAARARQLARQTGTVVVVFENGKIREHSGGAESGSQFPTD